MEREKKIEILGFILFTIGIIGLIVVFYLAFRFFQNPQMLAGEVDSDPARALSSFLSRILVILVPVLTMVIMGLISSKVASMGIELYKIRKN